MSRTADPTLAEPSPKTRLKRHLLAQLPVLALMVVLAAVFNGWVSPSAESLGESDAEQPQLRLREHVQHYVEADGGLIIDDPIADIVVFSSGQWSIPSSWSAMDHYTVIFRAHQDGKPSDIYRIDASAAGNGVPVRLGWVRRLTTTDDVDEQNLVARGPLVAFSQFYDGRYEAIQVLDLTGEAESETEGWSRTQRTLDGLLNLQKTGQWRGMARVQYTLTYPPPELVLSFVDDWMLELSRGSLDPLTLDLSTPDDELEAGGEFAVRRHTKVQDPPVFMAVNFVRNLPFIGPDRMAVVQQIAFDLKDQLRRSEIIEATEEQTVEMTGTAEALPVPEVPRDGYGVLLGDTAISERLPPPPIQEIAEHPRRNELQWFPVEETVPQTPDGVPLFYQAYVRTGDEEVGLASVHATVWDPERVAINVVAGTEEPIPTTTAVGTGRIPRVPGEFDRMIAAFNGGFQSVHGTYGMVEQGQVLVPPEARAATVMTNSEGVAGIGRWNEEYRMPGNVVGLRQNLRPLVEDGVANPDGRTRWGWALGQNRTNLGSPLTTRTGLCRMESGAMAYFYGNDIDGDTLGHAMVAAGCDFGIHLDMNPGHTGMEFYGPPVTEGRRESRLMLDRGMRLARHPRYINTDNRDFFYLTLRPNPLEEGLQPACPDQEPIFFQRVTATGEPVDPELRLLLEPPTAVRLVDHPLCDDTAVEVIRIPADVLTLTPQFYRDPPDIETLVEHASGVSLMMTGRREAAPSRVGADENGHLVLGDPSDGIPAYRLGHDELPEDVEYAWLVGMDEFDNIFVMGSTSLDAMEATLQRFGISDAYWVPCAEQACVELHYDNGQVTTLPRGMDRVLPSGFVLWARYAHTDQNHSLDLRELVEIVETAENDDDSE
ncbi:MAG: hypothetical protein KC561_04710 [Myxococcales bacterium]|nr:hypothetical protein [Myxococcales bacterium]